MQTKITFSSLIFIFLATARVRGVDSFVNLGLNLTTLSIVSNFLFFNIFFFLSLFYFILFYFIILYYYYCYYFYYSRKPPTPYNTILYGEFRYWIFE